MAEQAANLDQIAHWNEQAGPRWVRSRELLDRQLSDIGKTVLDRADLRRGEAVLDVGCGCGATTLEIAQRIAPGGRALGLDISRVMLAVAEERAATAGFANLRFRCADAQTADLEDGGFDLLFSRFGVMFFGDPVAAFSNLRRSLRTGGRLAFVCWQPIAKNPWMGVPMSAAARHLELPAPPAPGAPGPFAFGDAARVRDILSAAGFADVRIEGLEETMGFGGDLELVEAVEFILDLGPTAALLPGLDEMRRTRVRDAVREAIEPFETGRGVRMPFAGWVATARND